MDIPDQPGVAVWDPNARTLTIDFSDEPTRSFENVEHFSERLLWERHDLTIVGDVHVDEAGRERFAVLEA